MKVTLEEIPKKIKRNQKEQNKWLSLKMVECNKCNSSLENESVFECNECKEVVCDTCQDKHNCNENDYHDKENDECSMCGSIPIDLYECYDCNEYVCEGCKEEHSNNHKEDIQFTEHTYEDYVREKTIEKL